MRILHELMMNFRRFRTAGVLNVFGLSVAFAAFAVIAVQLMFQFGYDRFHKDADRIFRVETLFPISLQYSAFGPDAVGALLKEQCPMVEDYFMIGGGGEIGFTLNHEDGSSDKFSEQSMRVSGSFADILGLEIVEGDARQALTEPNMLMIPVSTARKWFGKESAVKKQVYGREGDGHYTVAAVYRDLPGNSVFKNNCYTRLVEQEEWGNWNTQIYVLSANSDRQALQQQVNGMKIEPLEEIFEGLHKKEQMEKEGKFFLRVSPLTGLFYDHTTVFDSFEKGTKRSAMIMLAIGILIILIAEINFVNFSISLAPTRMKAVNTQKVLGAGVGRLRVRLVGEAVFYSLSAFVLAVGWLHVFASSGFASLFSMSLYPAEHAGLLAVIGGGAVLLGVFAGLYPAWYVTSFEPAMVLKGNFVMSPKGMHLRNGLMAFQFVTSIVLIICTLFIGAQYRYMQHFSLGYDTENIGFFELNRDLAGSQSALISEMTAIPGVTDYTFADHVVGMNNQINGMGLEVEGEALHLNRWNVYKNFLDFIGVSIVKGENFSASDQSAQLILNETAVRKHPVLEHSFGTTIATSPRLGRFVGVIKDIHYMSLHSPLMPLAITCQEKDEYNYMFLKLSGNDLSATLEKLRQVYERLSPAGVFKFEFLDQSLQQNYEGEKKLMQVVFLMGGIAIVLALVGVYGLVVFNAQYKRKEIGIRKVNGATEGQIMVLLNRTFFRLLAVSFVGACPIAWYAVNSWLEGFSYKTPVYWWIFLLGGAVTLAIALLTVSWQSWKAASANPVEALKNE